MSKIQQEKKTQDIHRRAMQEVVREFSINCDALCRKAQVSSRGFCRWRLGQQDAIVGTVEAIEMALPPEIRQVYHDKVGNFLGLRQQEGKASLTQLAAQLDFSLESDLLLASELILILAPKGYNFLLDNQRKPSREIVEALAALSFARISKNFSVNTEE